MQQREQNEPFEINQILIQPGYTTTVFIKISELFTATPVAIPVTIINGISRGSVLLVTAAIHGDELNGVEIIRRLRREVDPEKLSGTLMLAPVVNPLGFIVKNRELPDGRDLNRVFPGKKGGSIASHLAYIIANKILKKAQYLIDLHTSAPGRANYPHIRADMSKKSIRRLAQAFGLNLILDAPGKKGTLRRYASQVKIPAITYEAGEPLRFDPDAVEYGLRGLKNVMRSLNMYDFEVENSPFQIVLKKSVWIRSHRGGILINKVKLGEVVKKKQVLALCSNPYGSLEWKIRAPFSGVILSTATLPVVMPGSPVCHLARVPRRYLKELKAITK